MTTTKAKDNKQQLAAAAQALAGVRQSAGAPNIEVSKPARAVTLSLDGQHSRFQKRHWFLDRTDDLSMVTDEDHNPALGITKITIQKPTEAQYNNGILARVRMESLTGVDEAITIWETKEPGDISLMAGGARPMKEPGPDGKTRYHRDRKFNEATTAQILSHVWKHLVKA
jgi:hypothetical protein